MWKQGMELMKKTLYDPHTWLDPEKAGEEARLSLTNFQRLTVSIKKLIRKMRKPLSKKLKN